MAGPSQILIRPLQRASDLELVRGLYARCADYLTLEQGRPPDEALAEEFFTDSPPNHPPERMFKYGMFRGEKLIGVGDMSMGYPDADDAYIGLLLLEPDERGSGLGKTFLRHLEAGALALGAQQIFMAVLDGNPRARAFWEREGFEVRRTVERRIGIADHLVHRMSRPL